LAIIEAIKQSHTFWGYRRVRAWLKYGGRSAGGLQEGLSSDEAKRPSGAAKKIPGQTAGGRMPRVQRPGQFWGIDMTKFIILGLGGAHEKIQQFNQHPRM
jgi:hypothetical protein